MLVCGLLASPLPSAARSQAPDTSGPTDALTVQGQEIPVIDSPRIHFTRTADGLLHARLYLSPLGAPTATGWQAFDPTLSVHNADGTLSPGRVPFTLALAPTTGVAALATLTNEDGSALRLGLTGSGVNGAQPTVSVAGQIAGDTIRYPGALAAGHADVATRATADGLVLRLTLNDATATPSALLHLSLDANATVSAEGDALVVRRPVSECGSTGCTTVSQPEYVLEAPVARDASGAAIPAANAATLSLVSSSSGSVRVQVALDPTWLRAAGRTFPITVDVPVVTAHAVIQPGVFGSVNSCAPNAPAPFADLVVGTANGCTYHGLAFFDMAAPVLQRPILSATLHLYAPGQTGPVGVQVYPGTPPAKQTLPAPPTAISAPSAPGASPTSSPGAPIPPQPPDYQNIPPAQPATFYVPPQAAYLPPSWSTTPSIVAGAPGIAPSATSDPWQSWDVTSIVRSWITQGYAADGGLVLASVGAPVRFASSAGAAGNSASEAPYLDLTFVPSGAAPSVAAGQAEARSAIQPQFKDVSSQRTTAWLAGGDFLPDGLCPYGAYACTITNQPGIFGDPGYHYAVQYDYASAELGVSYVRSGGPTVQISCTPSDWTTVTTWQYAYGFMQSAYNHGLIPIVTIQQNTACPYSPGNPNTDWGLAMEWFAYLMPSMNSATFGPNPPMYFEIGNEENDTSHNPPQIWNTFPTWFAMAAQGLQAYLITNVTFQSYPNYVPGHPVYTSYHFLTGGVAGPTPYVGCLNPPSHYTYNVQPLQQALTNAQTSEKDPDNPTINLPGVNAQYLAVASHPYGYDTPPPYASNVWPNYWSVGGSYPGDCEDLNGLIGNWEYYYFPGYRHVATEDNYNSLPNNVPQVMTNFEGAYMLDRFTWLYNNLGADGQWGYVGGEAAYPFNVLWYEGYDTPNSGNGHVGLLQQTLIGNSWVGTDKYISFTTSCGDNPAIGFTTNQSLTYLLAHMDLVGNPNPSTPGNHCN